MSLIKWNEDGGLVRLGLPGDLDLPMAQPLVDSLKHALSTADAVVVQAEGVERVSTACIQALLVASRHAADQGLTFTLSGPSEVLAEACDDLGLGAWLKRWSQG